MSEGRKSCSAPSMLNSKLYKLSKNYFKLLGTNFELEEDLTFSSLTQNNNNDEIQITDTGVQEEEEEILKPNGLSYIFSSSFFKIIIIISTTDTSCEASILKRYMLRP